MADLPIESLIVELNSSTESNAENEQPIDPELEARAESSEDGMELPRNTAKIATCLELLDISGNNRCFDCNVERPIWVNMSYCVLLCGPCAAIHAEFGLQVKPLSDQSLTGTDFAMLERTGNKVAGWYWLAKWDEETDELLECTATKDSRTMFIISKYRGKWLGPAEKAWLTKQQHAFRSQSALFGPTYNFNPESLVASTQNLSLDSHQNGMPNGNHTNGTHMNGTHTNGTHANGTHTDGTHTNGTHANGTHANGTYTNGTYTNGTYTNGTYTNGTYTNGTHTNETYTNGTHMNGNNMNGNYINGKGVYMNGYGAAYPSRNDTPPDFVMKSTVTYSKKARHRRHAH